MSQLQWRMKAERGLRSAELMLDDDDPDGACNRAYYAMFNMAREALDRLWPNDGGVAKTHAGLISLFGEKLVLSGEIDASFGRMLSLEAKRRLVSDYRGEGVSVDEAREALDHARAFVSELARWLDQRGEPG